MFKTIHVSKTSSGQGILTSCPRPNGWPSHPIPIVTDGHANAADNVTIYVHQISGRHSSTATLRAMQMCGLLSLVPLLPSPSLHPHPAASSLRLLGVPVHHPPESYFPSQHPCGLCSLRLLLTCCAVRAEVVHPLDLSARRALAQRVDVLQCLARHLPVPLLHV